MKFFYHTKLLAVVLISCLAIFCTNCRSKVSSKNVGAPQPGINVTVVSPDKAAEVDIENGTIYIEPGTFEQTVYIDPKPLEDPNDLPPNLPGTLAAPGSVVLICTQMDNCDNPYQGQVLKDILVKFTVDDTPAKIRLVGLIVTLPDNKFVILPHSDLTIAERDDGKIDVSFSTKIINAIYALLYEEPKEEGEIIAGSKERVRNYYQTRSMLSLQIDPKGSVNEGAEAFSVTNLTTNVTLLEREPISAGSYEMFSLLPSFLDSSKLLLSFYPLDPDVRNAFTYGENELMLSMHHSDTDVTSKTIITIKDFTIMEPAATSFSNNRQVSRTATGNTFQGWVDVVHKSHVSSSSSNLDTGMHTMINQ